MIEALIRNLKEKFPNMNNIDGISITFAGGGRILIRASNTGPKIRLSVEAREESRAKEIFQEFSPILKDTIEKLS